MIRRAISPRLAIKTFSFKLTSASVAVADRNIALKNRSKTPLPSGAPGQKPGGAMPAPERAWQHPCGQKEKKAQPDNRLSFFPFPYFYSQKRTNEKDEISLEENALRKIEKRILLKHHIFVWYSDAAFGTEWLARAKHGSYTDFGGKRQFFS
jgi:hypothetical protein